MYSDQQIAAYTILSTIVICIISSLIYLLIIKIIEYCTRNDYLLD